MRCERFRLATETVFNGSDLWAGAWWVEACGNSERAGTRVFQWRVRLRADTRKNLIPWLVIICAGISEGGDPRREPCTKTE